MQLASVVGTVVATQKDPHLAGRTLLLIQPSTPHGEPTGRALVAVDAVGAGVGERVFYVRGREASYPFLPVEVPTDAAIVGIVDHATVERVGSSTP
ncbi:MAG: ethanolamine utilization protein EutN [Luteitalea sp.]|nr:ethanolamine utilization protein EutN [Luteitalea sp.]